MCQNHSEKETTSVKLKFNPFYPGKNGWITPSQNTSEHSGFVHDKMMFIYTDFAHMHSHFYLLNVFPSDDANLLKKNHIHLSYFF